MIYREQIMDHYKNPRNRGALPKATFTHEGANPLCGDEIRMDVQLDKNSIKEARFSGKGCAISQASASMLTEEIKGKSCNAVNSMGNKEITNMLGIPLSPTRLKCALLPLMVLKDGIREFDKK